MIGYYRWKLYARLVIYFILLIILYQLIKYTISLSNHPSTSEERGKKSSKKEPSLLTFHSNTGTHLDFPWYKTEHTRPQFTPNRTLLTTTLSAKDRLIIQEKAVLRAKKSAYKRFPPNEYQGIRGTDKYSEDTEDIGTKTKQLRDLIQCWTVGKWHRVEEMESALKHIQDTYYGMCDRQFYKTHSVNETRESVKYVWRPSSDDCPFEQDSIPVNDWCEHLNGRNMLLVGDLVHYELHEVLLDTFRDDPTVCFGELNCKDHTICNGPHTSRLRYVRNDVLSTIRNFQNRDDGHPLANIIEWPFVTSSILSSYQVLLLSRTPFLGENDVMFTRRMIQTMRVIRHTSPDALVIYTSPSIGHPFCDDATGPLQHPLSDEEVKNLPYGWSENKRRNAIAKAVVEAAGGIYLDTAAVLQWRPDGHIGGRDCLRYCIPGPYDIMAHLLYHTMLALDVDIKNEEE
ncbi:hypothetical protein BDB01DRAFT_843288 [Pilobolus umbonatus]|nr:hypothetical protein BDB01DRAFT_843288 [Pilobolus umbonatus]